MVIVAGRIYVVAGNRDLFVERSLEAVRAARRAEGCLDFSVSPDPVEPNRVNVHEQWNSPAELHAFRGAGPESDIVGLIESAHVHEYEASQASS